MLRNPTRWAFTKGLIDPKWQSIVSKMIMGAPCWEGGGSKLTAFGKRRTTGTFTDTGWGVNTKGIGISGDGTVTADGIRLDLDLDDYFDTSANGTTFSVVAAATSPTWTTGGYVFIGRRVTSTGWYFIKTGNDLNFTLFGVAGYTSTVPIAAPNNSFAVMGMTVDIGTDVTFFEGGLQLGNPVSITASLSQAAADFAIWSWWDGQDVRLENEWNGIGNAIYVFSPALTAEEHAMLARDPRGPFRMVDEVGVVVGLPVVAAGNPLASSLMMTGVGF